MKRVQMKRTKDWRKPENTVYVGRSRGLYSCYANPWKVGIDGTREEVLKRYRRHLELCLKGDPKFLEPLRGKNLACWCRLDQPCHADVLLEFLEKEEA